jgi:hypothetical protein
MKHPEDVVVGQHVAGAFTILVSRCVFETCSDEDAKFFSVLVHERRPNDPLLYNVYLMQDERFAWFTWMQTFERFANDEDVVEFNAHVWNVFHKIGMPTYKLSRRSIVRLFERCQKWRPPKPVKKKDPWAVTYWHPGHHIYDHYMKGKDRGNEAKDQGRPAGNQAHPATGGEAPGGHPGVREVGLGAGERPRRRNDDDGGAGEGPGQGLAKGQGPREVKIPDNPPERTYTCPGCKKAVKATRIGESCSYVVEHLKEEKKGKDDEEGGGKCKYVGPVVHK